MRALRRGPVVVLALIAGGACAAATTTVWASATVADPVLGHRAATATGQELVPGASGLGLVVLAGALVVAIAGPVLRVVAGALVTAAGAGAAVLTGRVLADPAPALLTRAGDAFGNSVAAAVTDSGLTPWPWVTLLGAVLGSVAGLLMLVAGRTWSRAGRRYANPAGERAVPKASGEVRGSAPEASPDADPDGSGGSRGSGHSGSDATGGSRASGSRPARGAAVDDWDSLSRGEDPTL